MIIDTMKINGKIDFKNIKKFTDEQQNSIVLIS